MKNRLESYYLDSSTIMWRLSSKCVGLFICLYWLLILYAASLWIASLFVLELKFHARLLWSNVQKMQSFSGNAYALRVSIALILVLLKVCF
jgi:hypothetical protein